MDDTTTPPSTGGESVTYTFEDGMPNGFTLVDSNDPKIEDTNLGNYTKALKIDSTNNNRFEDGIPESRALTFTPTTNGIISVDAYANDNNANIYVTQSHDGLNSTDKTTFSNEGTLYRTTPIEVEANKPVYIFADSNTHYCGITFTPASSGSSDLAQEDGLKGDEEQLARKIDEKWVNSPSIVSAWDVTVADSKGNVQNGRAWSDVLALNAGNHQRSIYSNFYILTKDGFEYQFNSNGMQPYGFAFYANNRGFLLDRFNQYTDGDNLNNLQSFAHSFYSFGESDSVGAAPQYMEMDSNGNPVLDENNKEQYTSVLPNYTPTHAEKDHNHKIFFNEVKDGNPVLSAYTSSNKLADNSTIHDAEKVAITPAYTGLGVQADNSGDIHYGTKGVGGNFTFTVTEEQLANVQGSSYNITLDFSGYDLDENNNTPVIDELTGKWKEVSGEKSDAEKNNIVILSTFINAAGDYTITWDGKDNYGNNVPEGTYGGENNSVVSSYLELGTVHFPIADVERAPKGIKVQMLNDVAIPDNMGKDFVYYNNDGTSSSKPQYFLGRPDGNYPSKIGDGKNTTAGISTNFNDNTADGALVMGSYVGNDANVEGITDDQKAYGNYCAIDLASRYAKQIKDLFTIGVHEPESAQSLAAVSFVATNGTAVDSDFSSGADTTEKKTFSASHVRDVEHNTYSKHPDSIGEESIYGNTVSTGFIANITPGNKQFNWVEWEVTIPVSDRAEAAYVKIPASTDQDPSNNIDEMQISLMELFGEEAFDQDVSLSIDGDIEDLGSDPNAPQEETDIYTSVSLYDSNNTEITDLNSMIQAAPVLEDGEGVQVNKGKIYKVQSTDSNSFSKLVIKLKYKIISVVGGTTATHGLIIDNFYAPGASAVATFSTENNSDVQEVTKGNGNVIDADDFDEYNNSDYNEYNNVNNQIN